MCDGRPSPHASWTGKAARQTCLASPGLACCVIELGSQVPFEPRGVESPSKGLGLRPRLGRLTHLLCRPQPKWYRRARCRWRQSTSTRSS